MKPVQTKSVVIIAAVAAVVVATAIITATNLTAGAAYSSNGNGNVVGGVSSGSSYNNNNQASAAAMMMATAAATTGVSPAPENRTFWIDTIHLDGSANIHGDNKHPPEPFPANATYPKGGGFVLTPPDSNSAWNFRSFTFSTSQIVVYQGDRVTLNFVGVQGTNHYIEVDGMGSFPLTRGQIHTVTFIADKVGTINYYCHLHMPNMHGEVLVLPRPAAT